MRIPAVEEVIEQLREANEPVPVPLELPDEDQLVEVEEQLFINIPFVFKEFLLTVSDVVYGSLEPVTITDPQSHTYLPEVAANAWDIGVPRELIPICQDGDDYYCVDCYKDKFAPKCSECKKAIEGKALMLGGDVFCPGCFACQYCKAPIEGTCRT